MKRSIAVLLLCVMALTLVCCGKNDSSVSADATDVVEIVMEDGGIIKIELYADIAPITVENFKKLVSEKFYDGIVFHRISPGFVIQGGDPTGTGMGGSEENIKGEFLANGVQNSLAHERGIVSMARTQDNNDSASSQFFICLGDAPFLDGQYAAFGKVIEGMDVVDEIAALPVNGETPLDPPVMKTIRFVEE